MFNADDPLTDLPKKKNNDISCDFYGNTLKFTE